jgi:hypothetical protein
MNTHFFVLVSAVVAHVVVGMVWYAPKVFGRQWARLSGFPLSDTKLWEEKKKRIGKIYAWSVAMAAIMAFVLLNFITLTKMTTPGDAVQLGFWFWFGFVAPTSFINTLFAETSKKLWAINAGYHLASLIAMSMAIILWQ